MQNHRNSIPTTHCTWCHQIRLGRLWVPERRRSRSRPYSNVVCQRCRFFYFRGFDLDEFIAWVSEQSKGPGINGG
ncbi:MAG: hypothetical protein P4L36_05505 [Holophaga sp.]|nr:hypothetical protein [Holophaga sp.]